MPDSPNPTLRLPPGLVDAVNARIRGGIVVADSLDVPAVAGRCASPAIHATWYSKRRRYFMELPITPDFLTDCTHEELVFFLVLEFEYQAAATGVPGMPDVPCNLPRL